MRHFLFVALALASTLFAAEPPTKQLGDIYAKHVLDATHVMCFHERGVSLAELNVKTGVVEYSTAIADYPSLTTSWKDAGGITHEVTTPLPTGSPSAGQILTAITRHKRLVDAMKGVYPPAQP